MPDFRTRLRALGLKQVQLLRWVEARTGRSIHKTTASKWARGVHPTPPEMDALLATAERHPAVLAEIKEQGR